VPIFDAANILVVNDRQLLYLTSISGNFHGLVHLKEYMKKNHDMEVVPMTGVYSGLHIDSTICILNKNKVLYCAERINLESVHSILKNCGFTEKSCYIPVRL
jgi:N-dimethylarginine dimethylaminohydrolase